MVPPAYERAPFALPDPCCDVAATPGRHLAQDLVLAAVASRWTNSYLEILAAQLVAKDANSAFRVTLESAQAAAGVCQ